MTEEELLKVLEYKTAKYTVEKPLLMGASLAEADEALCRDFSTYAAAFGKAFQIQDDILGTFGDEKEIGKPTDSDIKEGKMTLLVLKTMEQVGTKELKVMRKVLGDHNASSEDVELVRQIIKKSGSLEYAEKMVYKLLGEAKEIAYASRATNNGKEFLLGVTDLLLERFKNLNS
jgi:geranylgeranyl diphosphate synthase type I